MILPYFFLEIGELKIATNCTIKHSYTVLPEINEAILLSIEGYCVCRDRYAVFQKLPHELCWQDFLFSVIFERVRSRSRRQKKNNLRGWLVYIVHQHRTPNVLSDQKNCAN